MKTQHSGLTLVETLVVIVIIAIFLSIAIPAVQYCRETARRMVCQNHLRQVTLAVQNHESVHSALPDLYNGTFLKQPRHPLSRDEFHFHSWRTAILPQLEQSALYDRIDFSLPATVAANQSTANTKLPVFVCPSTSNHNAIVPDILQYNNGNIPSQIVGTRARSDYEVIGGIGVRPYDWSTLENFKFGAWGEPLAYLPLSTTYRKPRLGDIQDGQSNTMLIAERGGRPDLYERGKPVDPYPYADPTRGMDHHQAAWAISTHFLWLVFWHEQGINDTNATGVFGFHPSGANVGLADGSVRFLSESVDQVTLNALATRSEGDIVTLE